MTGSRLASYSGSDNPVKFGLDQDPLGAVKQAGMPYPRNRHKFEFIGSNPDLVAFTVHITGLYYGGDGV